MSSRLAMTAAHPWCCRCWSRTRRSQTLYSSRPKSLTFYKHMSHSNNANNPPESVHLQDTEICSNTVLELQCCWHAHWVKSMLENWCGQEHTRASWARDTTVSYVGGMWRHPSTRSRRLVSASQHQQLLQSLAIIISAYHCTTYLTYILEHWEHFLGKTWDQLTRGLVHTVIGVMYN